MRIGIPKETTPGETRVAATPETVKKAVGLGFSVTVEAGAGEAAAFPDEAYQDAGADIAGNAKKLYRQAELVLTAQPPDDAAVQAMKSGTVVVGMLAPLSRPERIPAYAKQGLTTLALELLPRITRAQTMDVLSSQSNIAGYGAVLLAANAYGRLFPMMMTAAGTVVPARVLVLGAGVAGLQAIATARRLGAVVSAYDVRPAAREQVESLGASFAAVEAEEAQEAETSGGYAKEMSDRYKEQERQLLAEQVARANVVIATAQIPGKPAPLLITGDMVKTMGPGSVIVDLAAETGGNCEITSPGEVVTMHGVTLIGTTNLPARWPSDASHLYARNLMAFLEPLIDAEGGGLRLDAEDEIVAACLLTRDGQVVHPRFREEEK